MDPEGSERVRLIKMRRWPAPWVLKTMINLVLAFKWVKVKRKA